MTSSFFKVDNIKNETILRDFLIFRCWQHQKTKQFCETSAVFELDNIQAILRDVLIFFERDNIKNKAILRDLFQK